MATQWFWSDELSRNFQDSKKKLLGCKTMTLEFAGIFCPFLTHPEVQANQNRGHPGRQHWVSLRLGERLFDQTASILVRCLTLVSAMLPIKVHILRHPRESSWESKLAHRLSRARSTTSQYLRLLNSFEKKLLPNSFISWMKNPVEDWNLPLRGINDFQNIV